LQESAKVLMSILDDDAAYAFIRPPGHHSCQDQHEGFCIFNNVIILYNYNRISKPTAGVLIFDWDFHHGNGTQSFVNQYNHSNLYFISMHYYDGKSYPRTGNISENTEYILNVPFNRNETDDGYLTKFHEIVQPFIECHSHEIDTIIVSNGLDAHTEDPLGLGKLTTLSYLEIAKYLQSTGKKIYFILEGGYNEDVTTEVSDAIIRLF
jgi:acetoin utilization deacetylase AcuC-like enzyme